MTITTLIPAYKFKYCLELLISLRHQTVKPQKIIFSDDSPNQEFVAFLSTEFVKNTIADLNIEVVPGPRTGAWNNFRSLIDLHLQQPNGPTEFFHVLLDDDIIYPRFYERHLEAHRLATLSCVVSRRWTTLESGQPIEDSLPVPEAVATYPYIMLMLDADVLFSHTVGTSTNWLGELSNATFRSSMAKKIVDPNIAGIPYIGLEDLGAFLKSSLHAPVGYVKEFLGGFRKSPLQHSADPMGKPLKSAFLAYIALAVAAKKLGKLNNVQCEQVILRASYFILTHYSEESDMKIVCQIMHDFINYDINAEEKFLIEWNRFSKNIW